MENSNLFQIMLPIVTLIIGAFITIITNFLSDRRVFIREKQARKEQRYDNIYMKRIEFQRSTLLEMQEVMSVLVRQTAQTYNLDFINKDPDYWSKDYRPEELNEQSRLTKVRFNILRVRISDANIRDKLWVLINTCTKIIMATNKETAEIELRNMGNIIQDLQEIIGESLRNLDFLEDSTYEKID